MDRKVLSRLRSFFCAIFPAALVLVSAIPARADNPPALSGWSHQALTRSFSTQQGVLLPGNDVQYSSPVVAEVDGNPADGPETVVASSNGAVSVIKADGTVLWTASTPSAACSISSTNKVYSSPAVGAIYGDGVPYVVVGYGGLGTRSCDGGVIVFHGPSGAEKWRFSTAAFSKKEHFWTMSHAVWSTPALADTDGDGRMEIGFGSFDRNVYLLNADGSVRWYYNAADTVWSSPVFARVPGDPHLEMIIGTDISQNNQLRPKTKNGGFVYAFKTASRKKKHIGFRDRTAYRWQTYLPQVVYSAPIVANVLGSPGGEVLVGSGCFFPQSSSNKAGKYIKILRLTDGKVIKTLNTSGCLSSSPAIGDIEGRGALDVVATVNGATTIGGDGSSRVMAWRPDNPNPIWSIVPRDRGSNDPFGGNFISPVIADLDGNGSVEVVVANNASVGIYNGADGSPLTCQDRGCTVGGSLTLYASKPLKGTPAIADIDGDGRPDVVIGGANSNDPGHGVLYGWRGFTGLLGSYSGSLPAYSAPWPMYRGNAQRTGAY